MKFILLAITLMTSNAFGAMDPHAIGWRPQVGQRLPMNSEWQDESGSIVRLSQYFAEKPIIVALGYFRCMGLCPLTFNGVAEAVRDAKLPASDYEFLALSIDETDAIDDARRAKSSAGFASSNVHFLISKNGAADQVARSVGFNYLRDPSSSQVAHAAGIVVLTPGGKISSYLFGIRFPPEKLRVDLAGAQWNTEAAEINPLLLLCYHFDPRTGKYNLAVMRIAQLIGIATAAALALLWWRQRA